jgi:carbon-monoxide dehydrogenase large subunit
MSPVYMGKPVPRREDPRLIRGEAVYVDDLVLPRLLHAMVVRSPHAHARLGALRTEAAQAAPGVVGVFGAADLRLSPLPFAESMPDQKPVPHTPLAVDRVYFVGHPVAIVVAETRAQARDAADLVEADYEPLPAVVDPVRAVEPGSALTHPFLGTNVALRWTLSNGDAAKALRESDRVIRVRLVQPRLTPMAIEPRGCVAQWQAGDGSLTLWTSTQVPHLIKVHLPGILGIPETRVRIVAPEVGGAFGSKLNLYPEEILVSLLARRLGRPVKWIESRRENASATTMGRDQVGDFEMGVRRDGRILGVRARILADIGAYCQMGTSSIPTLTGLMLPGCYGFRNLSVEVLDVHTNKMATDAYRGAGRPEAIYAIERLADLAAGELGMAPDAFRRKNFPKPEEFPFRNAAGIKYDSGNYGRALKKVQRLSGWPALLRRRSAARKAGRLFGIGLASYVEICAFGPSRGMDVGGWEWAQVRIEMSGGVTVITGATPHGQGQETSFAQIAAEALGVSIDDVVVHRGDTATATHGRDTYGSRATAVGGPAVLMCAGKLVEKARPLAAKLLGVEPGLVRFRNGRFTAKGRSLDWKRIAREAYEAKEIPKGWEPGLEASSFFEPPSCTYPFGTHLAAVEVDRDSGAVRIAAYAAVDDCGPRLNPLLVEGQIQGGIAQGLGQALFERTVYGEDGQLLTGEFMDYAMPRAADIPELTLGATVTPSPANPKGWKGVGEAATIGSTPALVNAVVDALAPLGVKHLDPPLTPEKVWRAIHDPASRPVVDVESGPR